MSEALREMPRYKCHKEVWALKIASIDDTRITPEEDGYESLDVGAGYIEKHKPEVGGYFVMYEDGYKSYSPAEAFESGYTLKS